MNTEKGLLMIRSPTDFDIVEKSDRKVIGVEEYALLKHEQAENESLRQEIKSLKDTISKISELATNSGQISK